MYTAQISKMKLTLSVPEQKNFIAQLALKLGIIGNSKLNKEDKALLDLAQKSDHTQLTSVENSLAILCR